MQKRSEYTQAQDDDSLLEEKQYRGDQSDEFDALMQGRQRTYAPMNEQSEPTKEKLIISEWHVPCHFVLTQTEDATVQGFHVQPDEPRRTLLSSDQENILKDIGKTGGCRAMIIHSSRSWVGQHDFRELRDFGFVDVREMKVDTNDWWRVLYDPSTNEVWVDNKVHKKLLKYRGFPSRVQEGKIPEAISLG